MEKVSEARLKEINEQTALRNRYNIGSHVPKWMRNYRANSTLMDTGVIKVRNVEELFDHVKPKNRIPLIFAAGPTLNHYKDRLNRIDRQKYLIVCGPTTASFLYAAQCPPHMILVSDDNPDQRKFLERAAVSSPVIVSPMSHPDITSYELAPVYWFHQYLQDNKQGVDHLLNKISQSMFPEIKHFVVQAGCVTNQAILLVDLAIRQKWIEDSPIILAGADFGYPEKGTFRVAKYELVRKALSKKIDYARVKDDEQNQIFPTERVVTVNGIKTSTQMSNYKTSLYMIWQMMPRLLYRTMDKGILGEIPEYSFQDLVEGKKPEPYDRSVIMEGVHKHLRNDEILANMKER